jgi:RNA polymerase sigma-70 factor (ECF subfamily)
MRKVPLDATDISTLYRRHARSMLVYFTRRTFDADAALDLVAETFAAAFASRGRFRGRTDEQAVAWLYGIARHQLAGWYRRGRVEREALARLGVEPPGLSDPEYERIEELAGLAALRTRVTDLLRGLAPEQREILRLRVEDELSYAEIAAAVGVTEETARARVSRGLRALADRLETPEEVGPHA